MMPEKIIIDADYIPYRYGYHAKKYNYSLEDTLQKVDQHLNEIQTILNCEKIYLFIGGSSNFRYKVDKEYKGNRDKKKILESINYYNEILLHLKQKDCCLIANGLEADDALGLCNNTENTILVHVDKDLDQLPGTHFNPVKQEKYNVTNAGKIRLVKKGNKKTCEATGFLLICLQMLKGDRVDNIKGIPGLGDVKSFNIINKCIKEKSNLLTCIYLEYLKYYKDKAEEEFIKNYQLIKILSSYKLYKQ
jgi:5'-3' exonuclease